MLFAYVVFLLVLWLGICVEVDAERIAMIRNIVLYCRFIWLNGSITLIRSETERYDIVRFSKVTLSLWPREQALSHSCFCMLQFSFICNILRK